MTVSAQAVSVLCRTPVFSVAMQISYFHVPAEMPQDLRPDAAVVIDVLRATTTIAWSLHNGAGLLSVLLVGVGLWLLVQ